MTWAQLHNWVFNPARTAAELDDACIGLGLPAGGMMDALRTRLEAHIASQPDPMATATWSPPAVMPAVPTPGVPAPAPAPAPTVYGPWYHRVPGLLAAVVAVVALVFAALVAFGPLKPAGKVGAEGSQGKQGVQGEKGESGLTEDQVREIASQVIASASPSPATAAPVDPNDPGSQPETCGLVFPAFSGGVENIKYDVQVDCWNDASGWHLRGWQFRLPTADARKAHSVALVLPAGSYTFNGVECNLFLDEEQNGQGSSNPRVASHENGAEFTVSVDIAWALVECEGGPSSGFDYWSPPTQ